MENRDGHEGIDMNHFGETIRKLRDLRHLSLEQLAERAGMNKDTVWRAEQMDQPRLRPTTFHKLAHGLGVTPQKLERIWRHAGDDDPLSLRTPGLVPGYDGIPASPPRYVGEADEYNSDFRIARDVIERSGVTDPLAYVIVVRGDSMEPTLKDGDMVIVSPGAVHHVGVETGKVYAIWFAGEGAATVKRVQVRPGNWLLIADNPKHEPIEVDSQQITGMALVAGKISLMTELPPPADTEAPREVDPAVAVQLNGGEGPLRTVEDVARKLDRLGVGKGRK